jgi:outer membrane receptor protein involved in Fe transport
MFDGRLGGEQFNVGISHLNGNTLHHGRYRSEMPAAVPPPEPPAQVIVVTGRALPDPAAARAYDVETIGRERLANAPAHQLDEILKSVPGLQLFRRSDSTSGHPTSQGVTLRALGGNASSRALLALDGVPQADPFGGWVNWPAYDPQGLAQVRVTRGGGSVVYGPGALAGVIDMTSLGEPGTNASAELGSRESLDAHFYAGARAGGGLLTLDAQGARSDGFIPLTRATRGPVDRSAPYEEASLRARWIAPVTSGVELQASGLGFVDVRSRGIPFTQNRTRGADASLRLVGSGRWQWAATAYAQWRNFRSSFATVNDDRTEAKRVALQDSVPSRGLGGSLEVRPPVGGGFELRLGGDARFTNGETRELATYVAGQPTKRRVAGGETATQGLFAEATWTGGPLTLSGGARLDHWSISDGKLVESDIASGAILRNDRFANRSGWRPTARAGSVLVVASGLSLRSAAYLGWRMPTLNELFRPFRAGPDATAANALLDPERLAGAEAGVRYRHGVLELELTGFVNRLSGAIANVTLGHGPGIFPGVGFVAGDFSQRQNLHAINVRGIEASGEVARGPWVARLGASFTRARVQASGSAADLDGLRPAQTANVVLTGEVGWHDGARAVSVLIRRIGAQFEDDLNMQRIRPATSVDAFVAWPLTRRLQIIARGTNLLDETVIAGLGSDGTVERATPRTLWLGLRFDGL